MPPSSAYREAHPLSAAKPTRKFFDPWNSSSTGHQRVENVLSGSTSWRDSRTAKLAEQFKDGQRGGKRVADTVGAGSEGFGKDGRLENGAWSKGANRLRHDEQRSIWEAVHGGKFQQSKTSGKSQSTDLAGTHSSMSTKFEECSERKGDVRSSNDSRSVMVADDKHADFDVEDIKKPQAAQIFRNLTIYINGSTYPLISDHKLKRLLATHGARISIGLGRRSVTHVILGNPNGTTIGGSNGAGGGLASSKIQKEVAKIGGKGIKFVSPEWVLESIKAGKRLPEGGFANLKFAHKGQNSVLDAFEKTKKSQDVTKGG